MFRGPSFIVSTMQAGTTPIFNVFGMTGASFNKGQGSLPGIRGTHLAGGENPMLSCWYCFIILSILTCLYLWEVKLYFKVTQHAA